MLGKKNLKIFEHIEKRENVKQLAVQYRTVLLDLAKRTQTNEFVDSFVAVSSNIVSILGKKKTQKTFCY